MKLITSIKSNPRKSNQEKGEKNGKKNENR